MVSTSRPGQSSCHTTFSRGFFQHSLLCYWNKYLKPMKAEVTKLCCSGRPAPFFNEPRHTSNGSFNRYSNNRHNWKLHFQQLHNKVNCKTLKKAFNISEKDENKKMILNQSLLMIVSAISFVIGSAVQYHSRWATKISQAPEVMRQKVINQKYGLHTLVLPLYINHLTLVLHNRRDGAIL